MFISYLALRLWIYGYCGCGCGFGLRSSRSYFDKIPQSKEKLENFNLKETWRLNFQFIWVFLGRYWIIFLNSLRRITGKRSNLFFRTSHTSVISPFFYIPILKYYLLHLKILCLSFNIFSNFSLLCDFFTDFENSIFHKIPAAAAAARTSSRKAGYGSYIQKNNFFIFFCELNFKFLMPKIEDWKFRCFFLYDF